ncbi:hypothetical protein NDU88_004957 [Pleurodeles waltl]|uniref:Uncharacterized protein n=1 Tax=Pleurodeles waltl TaxID=8319 RepID=A0AAV7TVR8_PLEWA|nr:hypothetical protein NDU88_004957 [Pleurodeles waltl]
MTRDGGLKVRTVAKHTRGAKSKLLTPALGRSSHSSHQQDGLVFLRDSAVSQDSSSSFLGLTDMPEFGIGEDAVQSAAQLVDLHLQDCSISATPSLLSTLVLSNKLPPFHSTTSTQSKGKAYPLFSSIAGESSKVTTGESLKEGGSESTFLPEGEEPATSITAPPTDATVEVPSGSRILNPTSENLATNTLLPTPGTLNGPLTTVNTEATIYATATMEELMGQILVELRAIKILQEETRRETKEQLSQLNTHLTLLSMRVSQVEQRFQI